MATLGTFAAFASRGFTGSGQFSLANVKFPTGGNYIIDDDGFGNRVHVFTTSGTFAIPTDVVTSSTVSLKVLAVGGGGDAGGLTYYNSNSTINDDNAGGGGAGGSVVYTSGFTGAKGMSFAVTVGAAGGSSIFEGLHAATGGGNGGTADNFSRGEPGGRGGGGSWQNGRPSGPRASAQVGFSDRHPGYKYGTSGPAAPPYYSQISVSPLGPDYASVPSCTIPITYADSVHGVGNHQYRSTSPTPDSSVTGLANDSPYGGSFRSRGGGGAAMSGGWGGQGVRTNFLKAQHDGTTYEWIVAGGHGRPGNEYATIGTYPNAHVWRDAGHSTDGTQLSASFVASSTAAPAKFLSGYQNQYAEAYLNAGYDGIGSGGGYNNGPLTSDGQPGILRIAYKLADYPGGSPAATANIFGGTITTSTDGAWRYHTWVSAANKVATSINSQGWYIDASYKPYYYETDFFNGATTWPMRSNPYDGTTPGTIGGGVANTSPFYYYGDIPLVEGFFKYMMVGGGGARGRGASGTDSEAPADYQEFHYGGGGSGGIKVGTFNRESRSSHIFNIDDLNDNLGNTKSDGSTTRYYSGEFGMRPGYFEVRANSMLNDRLESYMYDYVDLEFNRNPNRDYRERNGKIRLRAKCKNGALGDNEGAGPMVDFLRCVKNHDLDNGVWGNDTWGSNTTWSPDSEKAWLVFYSRGQQPTNPRTAYVDPVIRLTNYDGYFYDNYFKVILHGRDGPKFTNTIPSTGEASRFKLNTKKGNWTGPDIFGGSQIESRTISAVQKNAYFVENQVTGVHPASGESYYNMILVDQKIPRWQNGNDRWGNFYSNVVERYGNGSHPGGATNNFEVRVPAMVKGLQNVDDTHERSVSGINGDTIGDSGKNYAIQYVLQRGNDESTRKFEYRGIHGSGDVVVPAGWKIVQNTETKNNDAKLWSGTTVCVADGTDNSVRPASVKLFVWFLRKLVIRKFFVHDVQVGRGGGSGRIAPWRYRSGAPTCFHKMSDDSPSDKFAGGGGGGGHRGYTSGGGGEGSAVPDTPVSDYLQGQSNSLYSGNYGSGLTDAPWGSAGGGSWRQTNQDGQSTSYPSLGSSAFGSGSDGVDSYGGGGTGGGSINTLSDSGFTFYGAPRGSQFSTGRKNNKTDLANDIMTLGKGGRGLFGSPTSSNWTYDVKSITCGPSTYYYSLNMDVFPHNASFAAGGGGGSADGGDATNGSGGTGGNGSAGFASSITGVSISYGTGGGGFGRKINGSPGDSLPPNPSDQTPPAGAPVGAPIAPAYLPYGSGGGWSAGKQEGGGADGGATKYYPGSGPWPASYPVSMGQEHMDAMRFWYTPAPAMPGTQKGDVGRPYGGKQGVVIVSYSKGQFIYPV